MGRFFNNLKGQIGRDTGKALSGLLYGDKHASVYRRVGDLNSTRTRETKEDREERLEQERINAELIALDNEMQPKVKQILDREPPCDRDSLISYLIDLSAEIHVHNWKFGSEDKNVILNKYTDALFLKFKQGLFLLEINYPESKHIDLLQKQFRKYKRNCFFKKNIIWIGCVLFVSGLIISIAISSIIN